MNMKNNSSMNELEVISQILGGDREAFALLVRRYEHLTLSIAMRCLHDKTSAEDASQEAFIKAFLNLNTYMPEYKFSTWLSRIVQNTCTDMLRKRRETYCILEVEYMAAPGPTPEEVSVSRDNVRRIAGSVSRMQDIYREPLILYHQKQMQYTEIANLLGIPMSKVKNRIFRARRLLKEQLWA